jgi:segregation and condensation protein B
MEISNLIPHIEALIFASEKPLTTLEITDLINNAFGFMEDKIMLDQIESAIEGILEKYKAEFYPFEVRESGGGWQFLTKRDFHKTIAQLNGDKFLKRLSTAALETLSIIAYKQPVTKSEIESIRGVSSDYAIQKLLEKDLIVITGRNENQPGHPLVYATSKNFMDYFGLNTTDDLPKLKEVFDDNFVIPTGVSEEGIKAQSEENAENTTPSLNGVGLNGAEISFTEEGAEGEAAVYAEGQEPVEMAADSAEENAEETDTYEQDTDESAIAEEAEALDEEADEVLDEIAEVGYEEDDEETFNKEAEEGFEEEEAYITPEEDEGADIADDSTTFKVDEDGELIVEHETPESDEDDDTGEEEDDTDDANDDVDTGEEEDDTDDAADDEEEEDDADDKPDEEKK